MISLFHLTEAILGTTGRYPLFILHFSYVRIYSKSVFHVSPITPVNERTPSPLYFQADGKQPQLILDSAASPQTAKDDYCRTRCTSQAPP